MLVWLENTSQFSIDSDANVTSYIDNIISCQKPTDNHEPLKLVNRQVHRYSHSCRKNTKSYGGFNYPQPPLKQTEILYPLNTDIP